MKKVLILGCGEKTELLVSRLCSDGRCVSEICLASKNKNECNAIKNKVASGNVRIITSGIDVTNTEGAMMMANIFGPDLIINLMPPELTEHVLCLALNVKAAYLDFKIDNVPVYPKEDDVLGTQFRYFAHFKGQGVTAVTGCGYDPALLAACIRNANGADFDKIESIDLIKAGKDSAAKPKEEPEEAKPAEEQAADEVLLYRDDLPSEDGEPEEEPEEEPDEMIGAVMLKDGHMVYVSDPKPAKEKSKYYRLVSDVLITDFIKEFPDFKNVRCLKESMAPKKATVVILGITFKENCPDTRNSKVVDIINRLKEYGGLTAWQDLSVENIYKWDAWLHRLTKVQSNGDVQAEREEVNISDSGVYNYHRTLGALLKRAQKFGIIEVNPYEKLRGEFRKGIKESTEFLSEEEISAIESLHPMEGTQMAMARDLFVFQIYTGLAYSDTQAFDIRDYKKVDGKWVNVGNRIKTGVPYVSQLLPQVVEILERYGMQTPRINNVQYNQSLKVIQQALGIKTRLHSHLGRHTFGTRMQALGAKLENVQKMMGHKDIRMTQRYAKVLAESVREDFTKIEEKLNRR